MSWDDWANLRAAATPTVRPPAPTPAQPPPRAAARPAAAAARVAATKPRAAWGAVPSPAGVVALAQVLDEESKPEPRHGFLVSAADGTKPARNDSKSMRDGGKPGRSKIPREAIKLSAAQQAEVRRCFGQHAEPGLMPDRPSHFVCIDSRKLDVALRGLNLSPRLSDSQIRAIVAARRQSSRAHGAVDLLEFTKIVAAKVAVTNRSSAVVTGVQRSQAREPVPVTVAPWLKSKLSPPDRDAESDTDVANFPKLGTAPPAAPSAPSPSSLHLAQPTSTSMQAHGDSRPGVSPKSNHAPPAGTLARQTVAAALAATPTEVPRSRGWEKKTDVDAGASMSLHEKSQSTKGKSKFKALENGDDSQKLSDKRMRFKDPRLNDFWGNVLDEFWTAKQSKKSGKKELKQAQKKGKRQDGQFEINMKKGKMVKNPNSASGVQVIARRGVVRTTPKKKRLSKLKRIILEDRERKYIDLLVYRWVYAVLSARIAARRWQKGAIQKSDQNQSAQLIAIDLSRYLMVRWLKTKRKQLLHEAAVAQGKTNTSTDGGVSDNANDKFIGQPETLSVAVDATGVGNSGHEVASATEDSATEDSATEDSATEEDEIAPNIASIRPHVATADDSATEDSATEDEDDHAMDNAAPVAGVIESRTDDSATEDSATEDDEASIATDTRITVDAQKIAINQDPAALSISPTDINQQYKPRVELRQRPANCLKVTFGNLPAGIKWPALKILLVEKCGSVEHARLFDDSSDLDGTRRCVVNFQNSDSVSAAVSLMGTELLPGHQLKVDYEEKRGPWAWLPEPEADNQIQEVAAKTKTIQEPPSETAQQAAERRLKIPRIAPAVMREYCKQVIAPELNAAVTALLQKLKFFQDRLKAQDPVKAKMRKRFVLGLREVRRGVLARKVKCVIMTPNIEQVGSQGGLDSFVSDIITECEKDREDGDATIEIDRIPLVFALTRNKLGKALGKPMTLSVVGLYDVNGAFQEYKEMLKYATTGRETWLREQARARAQPKHKLPAPAPELVPEPEPAPEPEPQRIAVSDSAQPRAGDLGSNRRLNANAPAFNAQLPAFQWDATRVYGYY